MAGYQPRIGTDHVWFNGTDVHDWSLTTQLGVRVTEMRGWDERPDIRDVRELRSGQDGEYADNLYLGGRTITISGEVYGSSWVDLQARKRALAAVFTPTSSEVLLKVPDPATASPTGVYATTGMTGYERASVRVIEPLTFGDMIGSFGMRWQVSLRASDPRVYSDVVTSTDSGTTGTAARTVTVDQAGTYATPTDIVVTGPSGDTWSVSEPVSGLSLNFANLGLASAETMTFDTRDRTVRFGSTYSGVRIGRGDVVAQWMLAETSGTTADNAEGTAAYDGTYTGGFTLNQSGPSSGIASVDLDGSTGYVTVPYSAALNPTVCSFEGWIKADAWGAGSNAVFVDAFRLSDFTGWTAGATAAGQVFVSYGNGAALQNLYGTYLSLSTWYHIIVTANSTTDSLKLYINGSLVVSTTATGLTPATGDALQFGRFGTTLYWNGSISAFTLYNTEISSARASELYVARTSVTDLSGYAYLDAATSRWANLDTASSTFSLGSDGLSTGSSLAVSYRDARL